MTQSKNSEPRMRFLPGRPMKYDTLVKSADLDRLYSPLTLVQHAESEGIFEAQEYREPDSVAKAQNSLTRYAANHMPREVDGLIETESGRPVKAWYGWRWQRSLPSSSFTRGEWRGLARWARGHRRRQMLTKFRAEASAFFKARKSLFAMLLCLGLAGIAARHFRPLEAWRVLVEKGPGAALTWIKDPRTNQEKFLQAWSQYSIGDLEKAGKTIRPLLNLKTDTKTKGDAYYLAGKLAEVEDPQTTLAYFTQAAEIYLAEEAYNSAFLAYLSMANALISDDDLALAENYLDLAQSLPATNPDLGYQADVRVKYFFRIGDYQQALRLSREGFQYYQGKNISGAAQHLSNMGFFEILIGDREAGLKHSLDCQKIILDKNIGHLYHYNQLNIYLYLKCGNLGGETYYKSIMQHVEESGDRNLEWNLTFVKTFPCEPKTEAISNGTGPPPPPDSARRESTDGLN